MDKDQVLAVMEEDAWEARRQRKKDNGSTVADAAEEKSDEARAAVSALYAELESLRAEQAKLVDAYRLANESMLHAMEQRESLRAMRKRVEATLDEWTRRGTTLTYEKNACAEQLRAALGDSHE